MRKKKSEFSSQYCTSDTEMIKGEKNYLINFQNDNL